MQENSNTKILGPYINGIIDARIYSRPFPIEGEANIKYFDEWKNREVTEADKAAAKREIKQIFGFE